MENLTKKKKNLTNLIQFQNRQVGRRIVDVQRCAINERTNSKWRTLHVNNVNIINVKKVNTCFANTSILGDIASWLYNTLQPSRNGGVLYVNNWVICYRTSYLSEGGRIAHTTARGQITGPVTNHSVIDNFIKYLFIITPFLQIIFIKKHWKR